MEPSISIPIKRKGKDWECSCCEETHPASEPRFQAYMWGYVATLCHDCNLNIYDETHLNLEETVSHIQSNMSSLYDKGNIAKCYFVRDLLTRLNNDIDEILLDF